MAEIHALQNQCSRLVELHKLNEEESLTSVLSDNSKAMSLAHSGFENETLQITKARSQLQDKLHLASKHVTDLTDQVYILSVYVIFFIQFPWQVSVY